VTEKANQNEDEQTVRGDNNSRREKRSSKIRLDDETNLGVSQTLNIFENSTSYTPAKEINFKVTHFLFHALLRREIN